MAVSNEPSDYSAQASVMVNGACAPGTVSAIKANAPSNTTFRFTKNFATVIAHQTLMFKINQIVVLNASEKAALVGANAPMVAV